MGVHVNINDETLAHCSMLLKSSFLTVLEVKPFNVGHTFTMSVSRFVMCVDSRCLSRVLLCLPLVSLSPSYFMSRAPKDIYCYSLQFFFSIQLKLFFFACFGPLGLRNCNKKKFVSSVCLTVVCLSSCLMLECKICHRPSGHSFVLFA